jgi:hypothetical protein
LRAAGPARREAPGRGWTWIALLSGLAALSALSGKVGIYALPLYPFLAILTARGVMALTPRRGKAFFLAIGLLLALFGILFGLAGAYPHIRDMLPGAVHPEKLLDMTRPAFALALAYMLTLKGLPILAGICLVFAIILIKGTDRAKPAGPILILALFFTVLAQPLALVTAPSLDALFSPRPQADILRAYRDKGYHAAAFYVTNGTYTFYMGGPVDEINDWTALQKRLADHPRIVVATRMSRWKEWRRRAELEPETFRVINAQWIAEREYVVLARDALAVSPAPSDKKPSAPDKTEAAPLDKTEAAPLDKTEASPPGESENTGDGGQPGADAPQPEESGAASDPDKSAPTIPEPPDPQQFLDGATPEVRQF